MPGRCTDAVDLIRRRCPDTLGVRADLKLARLSCNLAARIRELRKARALTQANAAKLIGWSQSMISRWENGEYDGRTLGGLFQIAEALNCDVQIRLAPRVATDPPKPLTDRRNDDPRTYADWRIAETGELV